MTQEIRYICWSLIIWAPWAIGGIIALCTTDPYEKQSRFVTFLLWSLVPIFLICVPIYLICQRIAIAWEWLFGKPK